MARKCPQCGLMVAAKWQFCPLCGKAMPAGQARQTPESLSWWERRTQNQKSLIVLGTLLATVGIATLISLSAARTSGFNP